MSNSNFNLELVVAAVKAILEPSGARVVKEDGNKIGAVAPTAQMARILIEALHMLRHVKASYKEQNGMHCIMIIIEEEAGASSSTTAVAPTPAPEEKKSIVGRLQDAYDRKVDIPLVGDVKVGHLALGAVAVTGAVVYRKEIAAGAQAAGRWVGGLFGGSSSGSAPAAE